MVTFNNTIQKAYIDVVQLNGNSPITPIVVATEGSAVSGGVSSSTASSNTATANLAGSPNSSDPELIFLASEGDFGTTAPVLSSPAGFLNLSSSDTNLGSRAIYTGLVQQNENLTMGSNQRWGTMALEING
jgi:hypothetical protein